MLLLALRLLERRAKAPDAALLQPRPRGESGFTGLLSAAALIEAGHHATRLALSLLLFDGLALVALAAAATHTDFHLHARALPVGAQHRQGQTLLLGLLPELENLALVEQQAAGAARFVLGEGAGLLVGLDVEIVEPDLAALDAGKGVADILTPLVNGFDLAAAEFDACLQTLEDLEIATRFAVGGDVSVGAHGRVGSAWEVV